MSKSFQLNNRYRFVTTLSLILSFVVLSVTFTNCGQPGDLALNSQSSDASVSGIPTPNPTPTPTPGLQYVSKSKSVVVNGPNSKVDILIIDDNSGSMSVEQSGMSQRFSSFLSQITSLDWQLGIVTTDVDQDAPLKDGRLIEMSGMPGQYVLTSAMNSQSVQNSFSNTVQRPETGSGTERGISAAVRALERSKSGNAIDAGNAKLFRSDAALAVIVVSNDDEFQRRSGETGNNSGVTSPDDFMAFMSQNYPNKKILWHSIIVIPNDSNCLHLSGANNEAYGIWYNQLSMNTGGIIGSVCQSDFGSQLAAMGSTTQTLISSVQLDCAPVDANGDGKLDVVVTMGGQTLTNYTVKGNLLDFGQNLPIGTVSINYTCLK
jgi:hypothetical protein